MLLAANNGPINNKMAKNTNPITKKLYGQRVWSTITFNSSKHNDLYHDIFVRKLIYGNFSQAYLLTSEILIFKYATGLVQVQFMYFPFNTQGSPSSHLKGMATAPSLELVNSLKNHIKTILELKFKSHHYNFTIIQAPNLFSSANLVSSFLGTKFAANPRQHRYLVQRLFRDFQSCLPSKSFYDPRVSALSSPSNFSKSSLAQAIKLIKSNLLLSLR